MNYINKKVTEIKIEDELKNSYLDYAMSVIVGRALPDVRDGLKPVHRRVLYAMNILGNKWNKPYKKSARIVGDVIGKYHPHGDTVVYDTIVRMAQSFSLRYTLIDGQGNFGSIDGDSAAAMRYTEIRMSKISEEMLIDLDKNTVDFSYNYDKTEKIPTILPAKIPNLLINGSSGIAVGMATNIPPHNLYEVINGCLAYINNTDINVTQLMKYIKGPDFPTSAIIYGVDGIKKAYETGKGRINIRGKTELINNLKNGRNLIIINEIPYQVNKSNLISKIADLVKDKKIDGIHTLRDESDKDGMRIVIELKKNIDGNVILNKLYLLTQLQISFSINIVALCNGKPKLMNLKSVIEEFINHRCEIVTRRSLYDLNKYKNRLHILKGLILSITNIDLIINIIRNSKTILDLKNELIKKCWNLTKIKDNILNKFKNNKFYLDLLNFYEKHFDENYFLSEKQIKSILDMRLQKLTNIEYKYLINEYKNISIDVKKLEEIIEKPKKLMKIIRTELEYIKKNYKDNRFTEIKENIELISLENIINKEDVVVTLSHQGYIKYQPLNDYVAQHRGGKGKSTVKIKEEDCIEHLLITNTHDTILCFSSRGMLYWMKVHQLPESSRYARGRNIINILPLKSNERITAILPICKYEKKHYIFMSMSSGKVKKTELSKFSKPRNSGIIAINLNNDDELIGVDLTNGNSEIILFSAKGKVVRFLEKSVRSMSRTATGVRGIKLQKDDKVVSLIVPKNKGDIFTVTERGFGKRTDVIEYPVKTRGTQGVISIKVTKRNGNVIGAVQTNKNDEVIMITNMGKLVRLHVSEVNVIKRNTKGVMLIRTSKNEKVVSLQRINENIINKI